MTADLPRSSPNPKFSMYPLLWAAIAFGVGIVMAELTSVDWKISILIAAGMATIGFLARRRLWANFVALGCVLFLGSFIYQYQLTTVAEDRIKRLYDEGRIESGTAVEVEGRLIGRPEPAYDGAFLRLSATKLTLRKNSLPASGVLRMFVPLGSREQQADLAALGLRSGDSINTACEPLREDQYLNPGVMPRRQLLDQQGIDATCTVKSPLLIEVTLRSGWISPIDLVYEQRAWLIEEFRSRFSPQTAGVMIASLLGDKHFLDRETADVFRDGGTFHVLVISGLHITFIGGMLFWVASRFTRDRRWQFILVCGSLWLYTLAVGAEVPVVRASMMFSILMFGRALYRQGTLLNSLGCCCLILLAWRPADLFAPSFQLTVVSVAAIVGMAFPLIEKIRAIGSWMPDASSPFPPNVPNWLRRFCETLYWRPHVWEIERGRQIWRGRIFKSPLARIRDHIRGLMAYVFEGLIVSLVVQLWMLPLVVYYFHRVSPISVFLNLWVGIVIAAESFLAIFAVLFGQVSDFLGLPFAVLTNGLNWLLIELPRLLTEFNLASFRVPLYPGAGKTLYLIYLLPLIVAAAILFRWQPFALRCATRTSILAFGSALIFTTALASLIVLHPFSQPRPDGNLKVEFLDVGQGDSAFVTFPDGQTMLIDGGGRPNFDAEDEEAFEPDLPRIGEMVVSEFLWEKGYSHVDRVVLSHSDADHSQGLIDVVRNFSVGEIWMGFLPGVVDSEMAHLIEKADRFSVPVIRVGRGESFEIGGASVDILWPNKTGTSLSSNNNSSLVMRLTFKDTRVLFTGDIEKEAEENLLSIDRTLDSDVIKVPHHGSRTSSTESFVQAVSPRFAIVPVGRRSLYGHPHPEVVARWKELGSDVRTTGENGTVTIVSDGQNLTVTVFKK